MDSNHIVSDEIHIERLFPKCTPNYNQRQVQTQRRKTRSKKQHRRVRSKSNILIGNLASKSLVNDTSSEELCSNNNSSLLQEPDDSPTDKSHDLQPLTKNLTSESTQTADDLSSVVKSHQTTNESPEPVKKPTAQDLACNTGEQLPDENMLIGQPNLARSSITPPGFAQRIRHETISEIKDNPTGPSTRIELQTDIVNERSQGMPQGVITLPNRTEGQRVKFNDENLVSVEGDSIPPTNVLKVNDKSNAAHITSIKREHSPLMPIIKEDQNEVELDDVRPELASTEAFNNMEKDFPPRRENFEHPSIQQPPSQTEEPDLTRLDLNSETLIDESQITIPPNDDHRFPSKSMADVKEAPEIELRVEETGNNTQSSLRHHRLLNESSHYSLLRPTRESDKEEESPRFSNLQFNSLSEVESEVEESPPNTGSSSSKTIELIQTNNHTVQTCDSALILPSTSNRADLTNGSSGSNQGGIASANQRVRRAIIFPCLDDGLSSEPESCEDDADDDDERAIEADVEADDDDDDDDGDEDVENTLSKFAMQTSMYNSSNQHQRQRQAQRSAPPSRQNRRTETLFGSNLVNDHSSAKAPGSAYQSASQETSIDLKQPPSYANQNGHWASQTTSLGSRNLSSQPAAFSNHQSNLNANNSLCQDMNKDEAKAINRLSSDTDNETDRLLGSQRSDQMKMVSADTTSNNTLDSQPVSSPLKQNSNSKEGSTHNECEGRSEKEDRILQAEMAVKEVKFRNGTNQPAVEVQLFISTEKIMVLDDKHRKIMMDHSLRTISYIADIGDAIVLIVRKKSSNSDATNELARALPKISCHVFESSESHTITKSISQAFQVAYAELIKANGSGDGSGSYLPRELDYQEVLNSQEMSTDEIDMFARKENQREVIVPKNKNEILGISIVESGWGSVLPTVVIASLKHDGPAYRCKKLSIGDQILSVNGISLVGLPLAECQEILRKTKTQTVARLSVVPCPITVEVKIKRPDTKYQLGFSVQNGVICSLLRGGIAERGGVRVGHRIMSINGMTVVGVPHEKIVTLLASSVGEIRMKTCLTSLYRHMLGEENPVHM